MQQKGQILVFIAFLTSAMAMSTPEFFNQTDLTKITWAHGVNSHADLEKSLNSDIDMLEADIIMGIHTGSGSEELIPVMAHPPITASDLSFDQFVQIVIERGNRQKGIKCDFKDIDAVVPSLRTLARSHDLINFPVWINADVLKGPVNSNSEPVDPERFFGAIKAEYPNVTLSPGWKTRFALLPFTGYTEDQVIEMLALSDHYDLSGEMTFPVRAGLVIRSPPDLIRRLIDSTKGRTLTIWGSADDQFNISNLVKFIEDMGRTNVYLDVPYDMGETTLIVPSTTEESNGNVPQLFSAFALFSALFLINM